MPHQDYKSQDHKADSLLSRIDRAFLRHLRSDPSSLRSIAFSVRRWILGGLLVIALTPVSAADFQAKYKWVVLGGPELGGNTICEAAYKYMGNFSYRPLWSIGGEKGFMPPYPSTDSPPSPLNKVCPWPDDIPGGVGTQFVGLIYYYALYPPFYLYPNDPPHWNYESYDHLYFIKQDRCPAPHSVQIGDLCHCAEPEYTQNPQIPDQCMPAYDVYHVHKDPKPATQMCFGNPIYPLTGAKKQDVNTGMMVGGQELVFTYDSTNRPPSNAGLRLWNTNFHKSLGIVAASDTWGIRVNRGLGRLWTAPAPGAALSNPCGTSTFDTADSLDSGAGGGYQYKDERQRVIESYNAAGKLSTLAIGTGEVISATYSDASTPIDVAPAPGYLLSLTDTVGRTLSFRYLLPIDADPSSGGMISGVTDVSGRSIALAYDALGNLSTLTWPDGHSRNFVYEAPDFPWALTGIIDENNSRFATWTYGGNGEAISSEHAGGVDKYSLSYPNPVIADSVTSQVMGGILCRFHEVGGGGVGGSVGITGPNGVVSSAAISSIANTPTLTSQSQPAGSGCAASVSANAVGSDGNLISQDDFQGKRICYAYDSKNRETTRVEGLANTVDCTTVTPDNAVLPTGARKTTTNWHPNWRLATTVSSPGAINSNIYHGQPDPFNAGATASCTSAAALPSGLALPLICKQVTQATLADGSLDASVPNVVSQFTYDASGRVLTKSDPLNRTTSYAYYADTSFTGVGPAAVGHMVGDLQSITNPAGHVSQFTRYDKTGRVLQMIDAKGVVTDMTYTPRGWISSVTVTPVGIAARTTSYTYDDAGQLIGVVQPDGSSLTYTYDAAHRLVGASDAKGNSVNYTLDNVGNRIAEQVKDPSGTLQRSISRSFDALNRLQQVSGAAQ